MCTEHGKPLSQSPILNKFTQHVAAAYIHTLAWCEKVFQLREVATLAASGVTFK